MKIELFGVKIDNLTEAEVVKVVRQKIDKKEKFWIATPNPEMLVQARREPEFARALNSANLAVPDGQGLLWAAKILGISALRERVTGADLMDKLCATAADQGWRVFLLGGREGVAQKALENLQMKYSGLSGLALSGPRKVEAGRWKLEGVIKAKINQFKPHLLFVGFGMGKQERWILANLNSLNIGGAQVVGGAFDFYSGEVRRAPIWVRRIGFEWFWRLVFQPWRWRRQMNLLLFVWLVMRARLEIRNRR